MIEMIVWRQIKPIAIGNKFSNAILGKSYMSTPRAEFTSRLGSY